jgi:dipeptidyl aminopeptidase/acylaminoacyl peptidase
MGKKALGTWGWRLLVVMILPVLVISCHRNARSEGLFIPHPDDASKQVEYFLEKPDGKGPWPTLILLHGHQESGRPGGKVFVEWGVLNQYAKRGALAVAVSLPGYGNSTGPSDFCGVFTQHAVAGVISKLRADGYASPHKLVIQGISRGAIVAGLMAAHDPSIAGIVLISGVYDLPQFAADAKSSKSKQAVVNALLAESGGGSEALRSRSVLNYAKDIKAAALILNGEKDDRTDPVQARHLAEEINRYGGNARAVIYPDYGHQIPVEVRDIEIDPFIAGIWGKQ